MTIIKTGLALLLLACAMPALAETPKDFIATYSAKAGPGFTASAARGKSFFSKDWGESKDMPKCASCHGNDLKSRGKHVITGKIIEPFSPSANPERFTSTKKVEKWFKRNCTEVVGRECTAAEKADFVQFVTQGD